MRRIVEHRSSKNCPESRKKKKQKVSQWSLKRSLREKESNHNVVYCLVVIQGEESGGRAKIEEGGGRRGEESNVKNPLEQIRRPTWRVEKEKCQEGD